MILYFIIFWTLLNTAHGLFHGFVIKGFGDSDSSRWHLFDVVYCAPFDIVICQQLCWGEWGRFALLLGLSAMLRGMFHNIFVRIIVKGFTWKGINDYGTVNFSWDVDGVYIWMRDKLHLNQYAFQIAVISILTYFLR